MDWSEKFCSSKESKSILDLLNKVCEKNTKQIDENNNDYGYYIFFGLSNKGKFASEKPSLMKKEFISFLNKRPHISVFLRSEEDILKGNNPDLNFIFSEIEKYCEITSKKFEEINIIFPRKSPDKQQIVADLKKINKNIKIIKDI